jgi:hypothetical protein
MQTRTGLKFAILGVLVAGASCAWATEGEAVSYNGHTYQNVGCAFSTPADCVAGGGRNFGAEGISLGGSLHWHDTAINSTSADPKTGSAVSTRSFVQSTVLQPAVPGKERRKSGGMTSTFRADAFYNTWSFDVQEGQIYGLNPSIVFGDTMQVSLRVPLQVVKFEGSDVELRQYGLDAGLRVAMGDHFAVGGHGLFLQQSASESAIEDTYEIAYGAFASLVIPMGESVSLSLGCMYEISEPKDAEDWQKTEQFMPAVNLGIQFSDTLAANVYGIYHMNADSALSDNNYSDVGGDLRFLLGETWTVSVGGKMVVGVDDFDSTEFFVGSEWSF